MSGFAMSGVNMEAAEPQRKPLADLPAVKDLPDPFLFNDGSRVQSPADWARRRKEIVEAVLTYEYGRLPPAADNVKAEVLSTGPTTRPAEMPGAREETLKLTMGPSNGVSTHLVLTIPATSEAHRPPFPVIVKGDLCWGRVIPASAATVVNRGYILAEFDRTEIAIDRKGVRSGGVYDAYPDFKGGALSAWAWGYHRCIDYLLTRPDVDGKRIAITGHSRGGKATLVAGITDERIALVAPNDSGCGGCGCYRYQAPKSETIEMITKSFPYWFEPGFPEFIGHVDQLPIDQHSLKAAVAPRAIFETEALADLHANPEGSQVTHAAAKEVYEFLGIPQKIGIVYREGKHDQMTSDFEALVDFADFQFYGRRGERKFDELPFKEAAKMYAWKRP
jgi:hypothetical protein